jgi:hypothetical protein
MGTIVKDSGRYVLKVSGSSTTYELDDQDRAQRYEGKQVKVAGTERQGRKFSCDQHRVDLLGPLQFLDADLLGIEQTKLAK